MNENNEPSGMENRSKPGKGIILLKPKPKAKTLRSTITPAKQNVRVTIPAYEDYYLYIKQSPWWARGVSWSIIGLAVFGIVWACIAKIDQVVPATGLLKPRGAVREVQVPINGIVDEVFVKEGEEVVPGEVLLTLDTTAALARLKSLKTVTQSLKAENQFYRALMYESLTHVEAYITKLNLPPELVTLAKNRAHTVEENQLYKAKLDKSHVALEPEQIALFEAHQAESKSRNRAAQLETQQLQQQLQRNQIELKKIQSRLVTEKQILENLSPLAQSGAVAKLQLLRQQQLVEDHSAEIEHLFAEQKRLQLDVQQGKEHLANTIAQTDKDLLMRIAENQKRIAEIDTHLTKVLVENDKRLAEHESEISQINVTLKYREIKAPVAGTVFDVKAVPGYVPASSSAETLLKIVPSDNLIAEVFITNQDIGFVREDMKADVRIDSFPFSEFGDIKGEVTFVGSDALPPDQVYPFHRFPAKVELATQTLNVEGRSIDLQSGMSVSVNIVVGEKRTVMTILLSQFLSKLDRFKAIR